MRGGPANFCLATRLPTPMRIATTLAALFATVATAAGVENYHMGCHTWPVPPKAYGPTNDLPIGDYDELSTLVKTSEYAKLYEVQVPNAGGNTSSSFYVTHVYGTPYQWGYGQGVVLKDEIVKVGPLGRPAWSHSSKLTCGGRARCSLSPTCGSTWRAR